MKARATQHAIGTEADPVMLEVFNNLFMNIAEQMGLRLQNTAYSVNIKERLDFSCALFDALTANLIANAPHMPVHLGSMSESDQDGDRAQPGRCSAGDVYVLNDPYHGGTHLPDVTVVTPVYLNPTDAKPSFYVGLARPPRRHRRHHAGLDAAVLDAPSTKRACCSTTSCWCATGVLREAELRAQLQTGALPGAQPEQNIADLRAQIAANEKGVQELRAMVAQFGRETVAAYMRHVQDNAEESVRRVITALKDGDFQLRLDNGARIQVEGRPCTRRSARRRSTSPAPARSCRTTSTRPRR